MSSALNVRSRLRKVLKVRPAGLSVFSGSEQAVLKLRDLITKAVNEEGSAH